MEIQWIDRRFSMPDNYKQVVLVVDASGFHGIHIAYFCTGKGFVDIRTETNVVCTHWCAIPKPPMQYESVEEDEVIKNEEKRV